MAGPGGGAGVATINQDAEVYVAELAKGDTVAHELGSKRHAWLHVVRGGVTVNATTLNTGDAAAVTDEQRLSVTGVASEPSEILLFDLA